jgi:hypothetical protein
MLTKLWQIYLVSPGGPIFDLNSGNLYITNWTDGLGIPPFHRLSERSAGQHGTTDLGFRLDPRLIDFHMTLKAADPTVYYYRRYILTSFIKPATSPFIMKFMLPNAGNPDDERHLNCYLHKPYTIDTRKRNALDQEVDFTLIAPDPVFFNPTALTGTCSPANGDATKDVTLSCSGTWLSYPQIVIDGPVLNPTITNLGTGEKIALDYQVTAGETVAIECAYGLKTVKNNSSVNLIGKLTSDSDLASFHIDPDLLGGAVNKMRCSGTFAGGEHAHFTFNYYDRFIGI